VPEALTALRLFRGRGDQVEGGAIDAKLKEGQQVAAAEESMTPGALSPV